MFSDWINRSRMQNPLPLEPTVRRPRPDTAYAAWWREFHVNTTGPVVREQKSGPQEPRLSLLMPVYRPDPGHLREALHSLRVQTCPHWELCVCCDGVPEWPVLRLLISEARRDARIRLRGSWRNRGIARATNRALRMARGEFCGLMDQDDELTPDAVAAVLGELSEFPETDFLYTDEDLLDEDGDLRDPMFKPDWSPDTFLSRMYTCHFGVFRTKTLKKIGGLRAGFEGAQDHDLVLRFTEETTCIRHLPRIVYHWRMHPGSTACQPGAKPDAAESGRRAVSEALSRRGEPGDVVHDQVTRGVYLIRYHLPVPERVEILIPTRDRADLLEPCVASVLEQTRHPDYRIHLLDNESREEETLRLLDRLAADHPGRIRVHRIPGPFHFARMHNQVVEELDGTYLLFLNNDTEVRTAGWLGWLAGQARRSSIGAVGAKLLYPDGRIQHAGMVTGVSCATDHLHRFLPMDQPGYLAAARGTRNVSAVTGACLMCRRDRFRKVGGFEDALPTAYNDVDFCFKFRERGWWNVCVNEVELLHHESASSGTDEHPDKRELFHSATCWMRERWDAMLQSDPYYSPHLSPLRADGSLRGNSRD